MGWRSTEEGLLCLRGKKSLTVEAKNRKDVFPVNGANSSDFSTHPSQAQVLPSLWKAPGLEILERRPLHQRQQRLPIPLL